MSFFGIWAISSKIKQPFGYRHRGFGTYKVIKHHRTHPSPLPGRAELVRTERRVAIVVEVGQEFLRGEASGGAVELAFVLGYAWLWTGKTIRMYSKTSSDPWSLTVSHFLAHINRCRKRVHPATGMFLIANTEEHPSHVAAEPHVATTGALFWRFTQKTHRQKIRKR